MYKSFKLARTYASIMDVYQRDTETHCDVPWRVDLDTWVERGKVRVTLHCDHFVYSDVWSIRVKGTCELVVGDSKVQIPIQCEDGSLFEFKYKQSCWKGLITVPTGTLIKTTNTRVIFHVIILNMIGIAPKSPYELGFDDPNHSDVVLVVENRKFYVDKIALGRLSSVFHAMFRPGAGWLESERNALVVIDGASPDSFETFLKGLYMYGKADVNEHNVVDLLELAHKYDVPLITSQCEKFLIDDETRDIEKKSQLVIQYSLAELDAEIKYRRAEASDTSTAVEEGSEKPKISVIGSRVKNLLRRLGTIKKLHK